jgi:hypothetical protein
VLVIHVGLPKTATTFLQSAVFPGIPHTTSILRRHSPQQQQFCMALAREVRRGLRSPWVPARHRRRVCAELEELVARHQRVLISYEGLSINAAEFWERKGNPPGRFAANMRELLALAGLQSQSVGFIIGIRRQSHWFASRYAQSARKYSAFSNTHFSQQVEAIASLAGTPAARWLDYTAVHTHLAAAFPASRLLFLPLEDLQADAQSYIERVKGWVLADGPASPQSAPSRPLPVRNRLSAAADVWSLPNGNGSIQLLPEQAARIDALYAESNSTFSALTGINLAALGYG